MSDFNFLTVSCTALISVLLSMLSSFLLQKYFKKKEDEKKEAKDFKDAENKLIERLEKILILSITYPYLENKKFCNAWNPKDNPEIQDCEKHQRYDVYCNVVFNFLAELSELYHYDQEKVESFIAIKDWVRLHQKCWMDPLNNPNDNIDSYSPEFIKFIDSYRGNK